MKDGMFFIIAAPVCFISLILSVRLRRTYNKSGKERYKYAANAFLMIFVISLTMIIALLPDFLR
ncbi:MAG: hypothetical protein J5999_10575 [Oscillospiraceae bacterium]|nr:hypothetical protein [Oscillospiraceae bacterium]